MVRNISGKCLVTNLNIICQRDFSISSYLSTSKIAVSVLFCNLKIWKFWIVLSCNFWNGRLVSCLLDLKRFLYLISCGATWDILIWVLSYYNEIVLNLKFNAYHVCVSARVGYASFAYVIKLVVFGWNLSLGTEPQLLLLTTSCCN